MGVPCNSGQPLGALIQGPTNSRTSTQGQLIIVKQNLPSVALGSGAALVSKCGSGHVLGGCVVGDVGVGPAACHSLYSRPTRHVVHAGVCVMSPCCVHLLHGRAKKLHEDRQVEMQQTLTQMNDRTEALDRLAAQKEAASNAKADAEAKLAVRVLRSSACCVLRVRGVSSHACNRFALARSLPCTFVFWRRCCC